ncbi:MAG: putative membrane protein [Bradymonadia bacterium]|jgi:putative membrane protein
MTTFLIHLIGTAVLLLGVSSILKGIEVKNFKSALIAAFVLGVVNTLVLPVATLLSLPITILTLGLFYFVLNGAMFLLVGALVPGFKVDGLWAAIKGSVVLSLLNWLVEHFWGASAF